MQGDGRGVCPVHGAVPWQGLVCPAEEEDKEGLKAMKLFWSMRCLLAAQVGSGPAASSVTKSRREGTVLSYQYRLEHEGIDNSPAVKDLRDQWIMTWQCAPAAQKAKRVLGCIKTNTAG